jgi:hypothetical protein
VIAGEKRRDSFVRLGGYVIQIFSLRFHRDRDFFVQPPPKINLPATIATEWQRG